MTAKTIRIVSFIIKSAAFGAAIIPPFHPGALVLLAAGSLLKDVVNRADDFEDDPKAPSTPKA